MTKLQDKAARQLELSLLSDVKARPEKATARAVEVPHRAELASTPEGASESDMSVYRQIAGNYFDSLRKK